MTTRTLRLAACLAALGVVASACGDDGADADAGTPGTVAATMAPAATDAPMTTPAPATTDADIVDTAIAAGDFTTLVAAVQAAGLEDTLRGEGPFTVFAPTDARSPRCRRAPSRRCSKIAGDLAEILTYHVVAGEFLPPTSSSSTANRSPPSTAPPSPSGSPTTDRDLHRRRRQRRNRDATDIEASNGVIHVIDAVLLPA